MIKNVAIYSGATEDELIKLIKKDKYTFIFPQVVKITHTYKLCLEAVSTNGRSLAYIPSNTMTTEMVCIAIHNNPHALQYLNRHFFEQTDMLMRAVSTNGIVLKYIPFKYRRLLICIYAIRNNTYAIQYFNKQYHVYVPKYIKYNNYRKNSERYLSRHIKTIEMLVLAAKYGGDVFFNTMQILAFTFQ